MKTIKNYDNRDQQNIELINLLLEVNQAYQGVGDFEGTGENMVSIIPKIRRFLDKNKIDWKNR